jgi:hypothetical protein
MSDVGKLAVEARNNGPTRRPLRFGAFRNDNEHACALDRVKAWTRQSLALTPDDTVLVAEMSCARAGCPPLETVITFWSAGTERHVFKVFKPVAEVLFDDLPPAWLKDALYATDPVEGECC